MKLERLAVMTKVMRQGMTLRDYFAAKAMQALIEKYDESPVEISLEAYEFADAMLKQREDNNGS